MSCRCLNSGVLLLFLTLEVLFRIQMSHAGMRRFYYEARGGGCQRDKGGLCSAILQITTAENYERLVFKRTTKATTEEPTIENFLVTQSQNNRNSSF